MVQDELIKRAREAHKQGKLAAAEGLYRQVLARDPDDPDANLLLGVILYQRDECHPALELIRKADRLRPDHPATLNNLGSVQKALGLHDDALASFLNAIALEPGFAEAHNNLGTVYAKLGRLEEAEAAYNAAVANRPGYIKALNNLGNLCLAKKEFSTALTFYGRALSLDPDRPLSNYNLGCALLQLGRLEEAEAALLKALREDGEMVEALHSLGRLYAFRFQFPKAIAALQRSIAIRPGSDAGYIGLGNTYASMNCNGKAAYYLEQAILKVPDSVEALNNLGLVYCFQGNAEAAFRCMAKANRLSPDNVEILCNLATVYMARGLFAESASACRKALAIQADCASAYYQLAQLTNGENAEPLIENIAKVLGRGQLTPAQEMKFRFGLAKLFEDQEKYDEAFACLARANELKRKTFTFTLDSLAKMMDRICRVYDEKTLHRFAGRGAESDVPIFIVGLPRSGSTLVEQILASHPDVHGGGELSLLAETVTEYFQVSSQNETIPPNLNLQPGDMHELGRRYVEQLRSRAPEAKRITDKMLGNYMQLGLISLILPNAKVIHCRRNPLDTCLSMYKKIFTRGHPYAYDLTELGEYYLLYRRVMDHWKKVLAGRFLEFSYEDLVRDQAAETRRLLDYCGLPWHEGCLWYYNKKRMVFTASSVQVRNPMTDRSVGLWKKYEQGLQPLASILGPGTNNASGKGNVSRVNGRGP